MSRDTDRAGHRGDLGQRLLSLLLLLYPRRFRQQFGPEMLELHRRRRAARRATSAHRSPGAVRRLLPYVRTLLGVPLAWRDEWQRPAGGGHQLGESRMKNLLHEARTTLRVLLGRQRAFTALCVLTLALGLGAATSIFSVVHGVLLAPLPYGEPERIVRLYQQPPDQGFGVFSGPNFVELRTRSETFETLAAYDDYRPESVDLTGGDRVERLRVLRVGSGYFETLGVAPALGRTFALGEETPINQAEIVAAREAAAAEASDARPAAPVPAPIMPRVALLSHGFWQARFGGDPAVLGARLELDRDSYEIIGVLPAGLGGHLGGAPDLWLPHNLALGGRNHRGNQYMSVIGRLAPGVSIDAARAELRQISEEMRQEHSLPNEGLQLVAEPLTEMVLGPSRSMLWILFAGVGAMLVIACINVANLFLARGLGRRRELGIRVALGAGRGRLFAAALIESGWIGCLSGSLGLLGAWLAVRWLHALRPAALPRFDALGIDTPVFAFSLGAVLATVLVFGLLPAARAARVDVGPAFGDRGSISSGGRRDRRLRDFGVSLQVALSLLLLATGALLGRSFALLDQTDMGFESARALTFQLRLPDYDYDQPERRVAFYDQLFERLDALPEIAVSGATSKLPGNGHRNHWGFGIEGREHVEGQPYPSAEIRCVAGQALDALGIPILAGRGFGPEDRTGSDRVVVVNRALVEKLSLGPEAIGTRVGVGDGDPRTIVGIVGDARHDPREEAVPKLYVPQAQFADDRNWDLSFVVTRHGENGADWEALRGRVETVVAELDPGLVVYDVEPLATIVAEPIARQRFGAQLMLIFAALALVLAAVGLFGALAYSLEQRRAELGLRMALGADRWRILGSVLSHGLRVFAVGAVFGFVGILAAGRWLRSELYQVEPWDPVALLLAFGVLFLAALAASWQPAARASKLDPARILGEG